ncbi:MAG: protein kinase [Chloroflexota bacterium]
MAYETLIGKTIGRYQIVKLLGRGGMAEVYQAYQESLDRHVAIKLMYPYLAEDSKFVKRFGREARTMAAISSHPNIVDVYDFDIISDRHYIVMQYIGGGTLKDQITEYGEVGQVMPLDLSVKIMLQITDALSFAHTNGLLHRDIKPANILLNEPLDGFLSDFGIAKLAQGTAYTATGAMVGTPHFMAPEKGMGSEDDVRCDIYSMGVLFYNMVTSRVPHDADTPVAILLKHINEVPEPIKSFNPGFPTELSNVVLKAMAKNPDDRYQSAHELGQAIRQGIQEAGNQSIYLALSSQIRALQPTPQPVSSIQRELNLELDNTLADEVISDTRSDILPAGMMNTTPDLPAQPLTPVKNGGAAPHMATVIDPAPGLQEAKPRKSRRWIWASILLLLLLAGTTVGALSLGPSLFASGPNGGADATTEAEDGQAIAAIIEETETPTDAPVEEPTETALPIAEAIETLTPTVEPTGEPSPTATEEPTSTPTYTPEPTVDPTEVFLSECVNDVVVQEIYTYNDEANGLSAPADSFLALNFVLFNAGSCPWGPETRLVHFEGEGFEAFEDIFFDDFVMSEDEIEIRVGELFTPEQGGRFQSTWGVVSDEDELIGEPITFELNVYVPQAAEPEPEEEVFEPEEETEPEEEVESEEELEEEIPPDEEFVEREIEPIDFIHEFSNCNYPGNGTEYRCDLTVTPYGGPPGNRFTVWVNDSEPMARYPDVSAPVLHFASSRRCAEYIHEVIIQSELTGERISKNIYFNPQIEPLFPGGTTCEK